MNEIDKHHKVIYKDYFSNDSIFKRWSLVLPKITMETAIKCDKICCNILENKIDEKTGVDQLLITIKKNE